MRIKYLCSFLFVFFIVTAVSAQVRRKGTTPIMRGNGFQASTPSGVAYTLDQLQGKWQEYKRTSGNSDIPFTDSLRMIFKENDSAETSSSENKRLKMIGLAEIDEDNTLIVAGDAYTVTSISKNELALQDDDGTHFFKRTDDFYKGANHFDTSGNKDEFSGPIEPSLNNIMGNWVVYKRDAKPGMITDQTTLIRYLNITDQTGPNTANATITIYTQEYTDSSTAAQKPATVTLSGTNIKIVTANNSWDLPVYVADGKEFVFGPKSFRYYCKLNVKQ